MAHAPATGSDEDKTLVGMDRLAVMRIIGDSNLLKNKCGFIVW